MAFNLVVARYNEDVTWLDKYNGKANIFLYQKIRSNGKERSLSDRYYHWESIPNKGREASTYLHYICNNYDFIEHDTVFVQGNPYDHFPDFDNVISNHKFEPNMNSFYWLTSNANYFNFTNRFNNPSIDGCEVFPVGEMFQDFFQMEWWDISYNPYSMFILTKHRLRQKPLSFYQRIYGLLMTKYTVGEQSNYKDTPYYGRGAWAMERLWGAVFSEYTC